MSVLPAPCSLPPVPSLPSAACPVGTYQPSFSGNSGRTSCTCIANYRSSTGTTSADSCVRTWQEPILRELDSCAHGPAQADRTWRADSLANATPACPAGSDASSAGSTTCGCKANYFSATGTTTTAPCTRTTLSRSRWALSDGLLTANHATATPGVLSRSRFETTSMPRQQHVQRVGLHLHMRQRWLARQRLHRRCPGRHLPERLRRFAQLHPYVPCSHLAQQADNVLSQRYGRHTYALSVPVRKLPADRRCFDMLVRRWLLWKQPSRRRFRVHS